jgi:hypothetical protein
MMDTTIQSLRLLKRELKARSDREVLRVKAAFAEKAARITAAIEAGNADVDALERELLGASVRPVSAPGETKATPDPAAAPVATRSTVTIEPIPEEDRVRLMPAARERAPEGYVRIPGGNAPLRIERA